jgi:hypothetical protein
MPVKALKHIKSYRKLMRIKESSCNYDTINKIGAMGAYGFMEATLKFLGYNITAKEFKANPGIFPKEEQEKALTKFTNINKKILAKYINKFIDKKLNGIVITEPGILAAAHLGGAGSIQKLFNNTGESNDLLANYVAKDKNNTTVLHYMAQFSGTYL